MSGKTEVGPTKYPATSDLQSGNFLVSFQGLTILIVFGSPDDFPCYWTSQHRDKNRQLLLARSKKMVAPGIRAWDLAGVDKSLLCLVARMTSRATGLLGIETKINNFW